LISILHSEKYSQGKTALFEIFNFKVSQKKKEALIYMLIIELAEIKLNTFKINFSNNKSMHLMRVSYVISLLLINACISMIKRIECTVLALIALLSYFIR
jgi:competence transcription factor ComK